MTQVEMYVITTINLWTMAERDAIESGDSCRGTLYVMPRPVSTSHYDQVEMFATVEAARARVREIGGPMVVGAVALNASQVVAISQPWVDDDKHRLVSVHWLGYFDGSDWIG